MQHIATVINNNQPGWTNIIETEPHVTLDVGTKLYVKKPVLAEKHKGLRVDHSGILGRIADGCKVRPDQRYILGELDKHLQEMAQRFYSGDIKAVDEFLQLYCLDEHRP